MDHRGRVYAAVLATLGLFLTIQLGALALVQPFQRAGLQAVSNPSDPTNSFVYLGAILVATGVFLLAIKFDAKWLIRGLIVLSSGAIALYVFSVLVPPVVVVPVGGAPLNALAVGGAIALALALLVYPEWYVIDGVGLVMGAGAAGLFGISFGPLPAIVLLAVLAVYDAISVYGTEHMLTLAEGVMEIKVPVVLVVPLTLSYSYLDPDSESDGGEGNEATDIEGADAEGGDGDATGDGDEPRPAAESEAWIKDDPENLGVEPAANGGTDSIADPDSDSDDGSETGDGNDGGTDGNGNDTDGDDSDSGFGSRDAFFIGLGDAVMPTVMVASAAFFSPAPSLGVPAIALNLPALASLVGTLCGLVVLLWLVLKGRAHAGLPLLNGGAIGGYLLGALASGISLVSALGLEPYL
jgi:presenilin-like A22 family membrane protease